MDISIKWSMFKGSGDIPSPRQNHSATFIQKLNKIVVFGGMGDGMLFNDVHTLDCKTLEWENIIVRDAENSPCPRYQHTATLWNDNFLIIVGGKSNTERLNDVFLLNLIDWIWTKNDASLPSYSSGSSSPNPFAFHSATVGYDNLLYIHGGTGIRNIYLSTSKLHLDSMIWNESTSENAQILDHSLTTISNTANITPQKAIENSDTNIVMNSSITGDPIPSERHSHTTVSNLNNKKFFFFGGLINGTTPSNDLFSYDVETNMWNKLNNILNTTVVSKNSFKKCKKAPNLDNDANILESRKSYLGPSSRYKHSCNLVSDRYLTIIGGYDKRTLGDVHIYEINKLEWLNVNVLESEATLPSREGHTSTVVRDATKDEQCKIFVLGGYQFIDGCFSFEDIYCLEILKSHSKLDHEDTLIIETSTKNNNTMNEISSKKDKDYTREEYAIIDNSITTASKVNVEKETELLGHGVTSNINQNQNAIHCDDEVDIDSIVVATTTSTSSPADHDDQTDILDVASALRNDIAYKEVEIKKTKTLQADLIVAVNDLMQHQSITESNKEKEALILEEIQRLSSISMEKERQLHEAKIKHKQVEYSLGRLKTSLRNTKNKLHKSHMETKKLTKMYNKLTSQLMAKGIKVPKRITTSNSRKRSTNNNNNNNIEAYNYPHDLSSVHSGKTTVSSSTSASVISNIHSNSNSWSIPSSARSPSHVST